VGHPLGSRDGEGTGLLEGRRPEGGCPSLRCSPPPSAAPECALLGGRCPRHDGDDQRCRSRSPQRQSGPVVGKAAAAMQGWLPAPPRLTTAYRIGLFLVYVDPFYNGWSIINLILRISISLSSKRLPRKPVIVPQPWIIETCVLHKKDGPRREESILTIRFEFRLV
jgi:hypothetical protein